MIKYIVIAVMIFNIGFVTGAGWKNIHKNEEDTHEPIQNS